MILYNLESWINEQAWKMQRMGKLDHFKLTFVWEKIWEYKFFKIRRVNGIQKIKQSWLFFIKYLIFDQITFDLNFLSQMIRLLIGYEKSFCKTVRSKIENNLWILNSNFYLFEFYHNFSHQNHLDNLHSHCNENCAEYIHQNDKRVPKLNIVGERPFLRKNQNRIMSGSCHFDNDEFSVEFWIFVIVIFLNCGRVLKFKVLEGCLNSKEIILRKLDFFQIWL